MFRQIFLQNQLNYRSMSMRVRCCVHAPDMNGLTGVFMILLNSLGARNMPIKISIHNMELY